MVDMSLSEFADIASVISSQKITKIRAIKNKPPYHPAKDLYKGLREGLISIHQNDEGKKGIKTILSKVTDPKKIKNYQSAIQGYEKWWGKKKIVWITPMRKEWSSHHLSILINPELGLQINDEMHFIKLYFRSEPLPKNKLIAMLHLMEVGLRPFASPNSIFAVLDVRQSRLYKSNPKDISSPLFVDAEFAFISAVWDQV